MAGGNSDRMNAANTAAPIVSVASTPSAPLASGGTVEPAGGGSGLALGVNDTDGEMDGVAEMLGDALGVCPVLALGDGAMEAAGDGDADGVAGSIHTSAPHAMLGSGHVNTPL
jgi:hypothetical protein